MSTKNKKFIVGVRNQVANSGVLELHFLDIIEDKFEFDWYYGFEETRIVEEVVNQVKEANPSTILCIIDSEGGDAGKGLAIYNFLKNFKAKVEVEIIGMAGSIASVIAFAASKGKLRIARNGFMVIHKAWGYGIGNSKDLRQAADVIDKYTDQIVDIYSQRTGRSTEEIHMLIDDGDFWMTGREAQELGFADATFNDNENFAIAARIGSLDANYRNVPRNLKLSTVKNQNDTTPPEESANEGEGNDTTEENTDSAEETSSADNTTPEENGTDKTIIEKITNTVMDLKKQFATIITGIKNKKIDSKAENISEQVANLLSEPVGQMADTLQEEVMNEINTLKDDFENRLSVLEKANAKLLETNNSLEKELADNKGKETTPKNESGVTPIGMGIK